MDALILHVISLRYSSWSMRPWLALHHAGAVFETRTASLDLSKQTVAPSGGMAALSADELAARRAQGSVRGLFPVLQVGDARIHESLAIGEWVAERFPAAGLWPDDVMARAQARALCCEMLSGFSQLRTHLSCHLFARVPGFRPDEGTRREIGRVFELWSEALARSGGPYLFGRFTLADAMYYPVRTRFRTYDVAVPAALQPYVDALDDTPCVRALTAVARDAPRIAAYDDYVRGLGGDPDAARG
ncbi:MAG: glutathione S-transferase N-terminal domain-containing protein [Polyangiales bacterium]